MFLFHKKKTGRKKEEDKKEEIIINKYSFINKSNNLDECVICLEKMRESENYMIEITYEINGEKQMIVGLTKAQADDILAKGLFGITATNLLEIKEYA